MEVAIAATDMLLGKRALRLGALLIGVLATGCTAPPGRHDRIVDLPKPTGHYAVGRTAFEWTDERRNETLGPDPAAKRELLIWAWYPARAAAGTGPAAYLPREWEDLRHGQGNMPGTNPRTVTVRPNAATDPELASDQATFPVLVMAPGLGFLATDYTTFVEELASHGYVVLGVNITYVSSVVVFSDGRVARSTRAAQGAGASEADRRKLELEQLVQLWVADERFVLDQLVRLNATAQGGRFAGRLDLQRVGLVGHSFGGAIALEVCRIDARCKAGVNLDGYPIAETGELHLERPFMFIWSEPSSPADEGWRRAVQEARRLTSRAPGGGHHFSIRGTRHLTFTDKAVISDSPGAQGAMGLRAAATYTRMFFDRYLRGRDVPLPPGGANQSSEVVFVELEREPPSSR